MRNAFELGSQTWYSEVTVSHVRSHDGITARLGNRRPDGSFLPPGHTWGTPWGFDPPFGRVVLLGGKVVGFSGPSRAAQAVVRSFPHT